MVLNETQPGFGLACWTLAALFVCPYIWAYLGQRRGCHYDYYESSTWTRMIMLVLAGAAGVEACPPLWPVFVLLAGGGLVALALHLRARPWEKLP